MKNNKKITVLGGGLVGSAIARDLSEDYEVLCIDLNEDNLAQLQDKGISTQKGNALDIEYLSKLALETDLFIGAVPGSIGYELVSKCIEVGKNIVDISFFPENSLDLDEKAKGKGIAAIVDCGVAPGMGNIILGYENNKMEVDHYYCCVGGLPHSPVWPFNYKAVFSPSDVIEEYTRPARFKINGDFVTREALSDLEMEYFPEVGTLESWNSDGLRSLLYTMPHIPTMIEKTLRYPGTTEILRAMRAAGFFSEEKIEVNGVEIKPVDFTSKLLFPKWKLEEGETEFTVMKVKISGRMDGKQREVEYRLYDEMDTEQGVTSMARTTGYTATAAARLILETGYSEKGIIPPEYLGKKKTDFDFILEQLKQRNVIYNYKESFK